MKNKTFLKKMFLIVGTVFTILVLFVCYNYSTNSPHRVLNASIQSVQRKNAASLLSLADPNEIVKYNLDETKIRRFLLEHHITLNPDAPIKTTRLEQGQDGVALFEVRFNDTPKDQPFHFIVNDSPDHGWRLNLTATLYYMCFQKYGSDAPKIWRNFKRQNGILGTRQIEGNFAFDEITVSQKYHGAE